MIARTTLFAFVSLLVGAACSPGNNTVSTKDTSTSAAPVAADPQAVRQFLDSSAARFKAAFERGDTTDIMVDYADDAMLIASGETQRGRASISKWYTDGFAQATFKDLRAPIDDVILSGDLAVETSTFEATLQPKNGGRETKLKGRSILVWKRQPDGAWKIVRDITVSDNPRS